MAAHLMLSGSIMWDKAYRPLPYLFLASFMVWSVLVCIWVFNTWTKRHYQNGNLQWMLTIVPVMKALVLGLSFLFWFSCLHLSMCSFWVAFGIFVTRIFLETACFVAFLLISHGYCIMHEQLSISERRSIAGMVSLLYLTLTGYKAAVPQFSVFMMLIYLLMLYVIFLHLSKNIAFLREQLRNIEDDGVQVMHTAVYTKYSMFKKFKAAMLMMVFVEILMNLKCNGVASEYWIHLLVREWTEIVIFFYIGWTFRSRELTPFFTIVPTHNSMQERTLPPIFSIPTSQSMDGDVHWPMLVVVQHPSASRDESFKDVPCSKESVSCVLKSSKSNINISRSISSPLPRSHSFSLLPDSTSLESLQSSSQSSQYHVPKGSNGEKYYKNENHNLYSRNKIHEKDITEHMPDVLVDIKGIRNFSFDPSSRSKGKEWRELQNLEQQSFVVRSSTLAL
ncbi:uncharacterized protein LOC131072698 isoform X2 [Cryptomeria japonica]|uniref:uncharacterized protein LOC131072698 isoform X2 n=1 Tax=Cryptomeria japonica TaxID=3369 RepID=UPI0025AD2093|nr:uncharacterized protein LOC131072698 isoform X2 [Cryptomeria japonica]